jgi:hypothetical protein
MHLHTHIYIHTYIVINEKGPHSTVIPVGTTQIAAGMRLPTRNQLKNQYDNSNTIFKVN